MAAQNATPERIPHRRRHYLPPIQSIGRDLRFLTVMVVLLFSVCTTARVPDRCAYKWGMDCFVDKKCLWEPSGGEMEPLFELSASRVSDSVCPKIVDAVIAERDIDLDRFLNSTDVCVPFCDDYGVEDCTTFLYDADAFGVDIGNASAPDASVIKNENLLRRLKEVFDSGELSEARRVLTTHYFPETFGAFLEKMMKCETCTECYEDPREFSKSLSIFAHLERWKLLRICEALFKPDEEDCSSRCDPERLSPEDCYKEDDLCHCSGAMESEMVDEEYTRDVAALMNTQDVLCPWKNEIEDHHIEAVCQNIVAAQEYVDTYPTAVCRALCPISGGCRRGFMEREDLDDLMSDSAIFREPSGDGARQPASSSEHESSRNPPGGWPLSDVDANLVAAQFRRRLQSVDASPESSNEDDQQSGDDGIEEATIASLDDLSGSPESTPSPVPGSDTSQQSDQEPSDIPEPSVTPGSTPTPVPEAVPTATPVPEPLTTPHPADEPGVPEASGSSPSSESDYYYDDELDISPSTEGVSPSSEILYGPPSTGLYSEDAVEDITDIPVTEEPEIGVTPSPSTAAYSSISEEFFDADIAEAAKTKRPSEPRAPPLLIPSYSPHSSAPQSIEPPEDDIEDSNWPAYASNEMNDFEERIGFLGPLNCALCEHCKETPRKYTDFQSVDDCVAFVKNDVLSHCDNKTDDTLAEDKICHDNCVPRWNAENCSMITSKEVCHREKACRWNDRDHNPMDAFFSQRIASHQTNFVCPSLGRVLLDLNATNIEDRVDMCRETLGCHTIDETLCDFFGIRRDEGSPGRKLLSFSRAQKLKFRSSLLKKQWGRQLLDAFSMAERISDLEMETIPETLMTCFSCEICSNETIQLWSLYDWTEDVVEDTVLSCRNETTGWNESSHCQPVCSTIPESNCALYDEFCHCAVDDEGDEPHGPGGDHSHGSDGRPYGPSSPPGDERDGYCSTDWDTPELLCYMKLDGNCSDGCSMEVSPRPSREEYLTSYYQTTKRAVESIKQTINKFSDLDLSDMTPVTVCELAGFCRPYLNQIGDHASRDSDCIFCAQFEETKELTEYLIAFSSAANETAIKEMVENIRNRYYGQGHCGRGCYYIEEEMECQMTKGCKWHPRHDKSDGEPTGEPEEANCQCYTRMDADTCSLTKDHRCSEGCQLNANVLLKTWKTTERAAQDLLRRGREIRENPYNTSSTYQICQDLEACRCDGYFVQGNCTDCTDCAESSIAYEILEVVDRFDYHYVHPWQHFDVPDDLRDLLMHFALKFLHAEICYLPECKQLKNTAKGCSTKKCEAYCELHNGYWVDRNFTVPIDEPEPECRCEAHHDLDDDCSYSTLTEQCSEGCTSVEGTSWRKLYNEYYQNNLVYALTILAGFKEEASRQRSAHDLSVSAHDVCRWIQDCPSNNLTCWDLIEARAEIPEDCESCADCAESDAVQDVIYVLESTTEDYWNTGLSLIAENYAREEASRDACQSSMCKGYGYDRCFNQTQCRWHCDRSETFDDENDDGCTDFMINFRANLNSPETTCNDTTNITYDECLDSIAFLKILSDNGHLSTMESRLKICKMFKQMPTTKILKERLGFLLCDPSQQCCRSTTAFDDVGIVLTEQSCNTADGCQYSTECAPLVDPCYESLSQMESDSLPSCTDECRFVQSSSVGSVELIEGRGFCYDPFLAQTCRLNGPSGCTDERCIEKPVCRPEIGKDYSCLSGDPCCVPTSDGSIDSAACASETCQLGSRCALKADKCGYFTNKRDCEYQKACQYIQDGNPYDRWSGKCVAKKNRCENRDSTNCEESEDCVLIDSCETKVCDDSDTCCPLSVDECQSDGSCVYDGSCALKDELNICQRLNTGERCNATYGLCEWNEDGAECVMAEDECSSVRTRRQCSFFSRCVYEKACFGACRRCQTCLGTFEGAFGEFVFDDTVDVPAVQDEFLSMCLETNHPYNRCFRVSRRIAVSRGTWAERPGAICLALGDCKESCTDDTEAAISRCTATGWDDGVNNSIVDPCADCQDGEYCRRRGSEATCTCNAKTGFDTCKILGECVDKCARYTNKIAQYNSYVTACEDAEDCPEDFICDENATSRNMTCSLGQISIVRSNGACVPSSRVMTRAQFGDSGRTISVDLNFPARRARFLASEIFDDETVELTGDAFVSVARKSMMIYLRHGAKIVENDTLVLKDDQSRLRDAIQGTAFVNGDDPLSVETCSDCASPTVYINYPERISAGCSYLEPPKATFDGSLTTDYTGRRLTCQWGTGVDGDDSQCFRSSTDTDVRSSCATLTDKLVSKSSRSMSLEPSFVGTLAQDPGFYTIGLTCTNFLQMSHTREIEFEVIGDPMPLVSVPPSVYFLKSLGVVVPSFISQDSICRGDVVLYNWTSIDLDIPDGSYTKKNFRMIGYVGAFEQDNYTLSLEAALKKSNGDLRSEVGRAEVTLYPVRTPVVSELDGPSGDVLVEDTVEFEYSCYDPDDTANVIGAFGYERFCLRGNEADQELSTDDASTQPCQDLGDLLDDGRIVIDTTSLTMDVWYIYTFTCTKDDREHSSTITFRPRSLTSGIPTGTVTQLCGGTCPELHDPNQDLLLMVDLALDDTDITWQCSVTLESDQVKETVFNQKRLTILGGSLPEVDSIDCEAQLSRDGQGGSARITIMINSKPYCSDDDGCIEEEAVDGSYEFPLAKIKLTALNFADDQEEALTFVFGCYNGDDTRRVYFKSTSSNYEVGGLESGDHRCFVCAVDKIGSEVCEETNITIVEPAGGLTAEVLDAVLDAVDTAVASKDVHAVISSVNTAVRVLNRSVEADGLEEAVGPETEQASRRRRLLSTSTADPEELATSVIGSLDFDPYVATEFTPAASTLATLSTSVSYAMVVTIAEKFDEALEASALDETSYTSAEAEQLTADVAKVMAVMVEDWTDDTSSLTSMTTYSSLLSYIEDLMCSNVALSQEAEASATLDSGDGIYVACMKDQPSVLAGTSFTAGDVSVAFSSDLATDCGSDCPSTIEFRVSVTDSDNLHVGFLDTLVPLVGASEIETLSGIVKLEVVDAVDDTLCQSEGCALTVTIPVSDYASNKTTACVRVNGVSAEGLDDSAGIAFVNGSYSEVDETVQCEVQQLGEIFVVNYVALDPEDVISDIETLTTLSDTPDDTEEPEVVSAELTFADLDYGTYAIDQAAANDFTVALEYQLSQSSTIDGATYDVTNLREGSVIATIEITLPTDVAQSDVDGLVTTYSDDASALFDSAFLTQYGPVSVRFLSAPGHDFASAPDATDIDEPTDAESRSGSPETSGEGPDATPSAPAPDPFLNGSFSEPEGKKDDGPNLVVIIVPVVIAVLLLGGVAAFFATRACRRRNDFLDDL